MTDRLISLNAAVEAVKAVTPTPLTPEVLVFQHDEPPPVLTPEGAYWASDTISVWLIWDVAATVSYGRWRIRIDVYSEPSK